MPLHFTIPFRSIILNGYRSILYGKICEVILSFAPLEAISMNFQNCNTFNYHLFIHSINTYCACASTRCWPLGM